MTVTYVKRYRMEIDLSRLPLMVPLPTGYFWVGWHDAMLDHHAYTKFRCFEHEFDARLFPCLGDRQGCRQLMHEISARRGFIPEATWLVGSRDGYVGTIQGVSDRISMGMIQNLGVVPEARGSGIGRCLLLKCLHAFRLLGLAMGTLEVTADNFPAIRLYRRIGFKRSKTVYKAMGHSGF